MQKNRATATSLKTRTSLMLVILLLCFGSSSCGYTLATNSPSIVGDGTKTLKFKEIDNPTLESWLPYNIRSAIRDEINARHLAQWVDSGDADYEISIKIHSYTSREWMTSENDVAMLFENTLSLEAIIYSGVTNKEVWRSGLIAYSERSEDAGEKAGAQEIIVQVARQLADKMRNTF